MKISPRVVGRLGLLSLGLLCAPAVAAAMPGVDGGRPAVHARVPGDGSAGDDARRNGAWSRTHPLTIRRGVLTVDGLTVKSGLSYRVADLRYMYVYVPGTGTTIISERPFGGAEEQRGAFRGRTLTVSAGGNRLQLTAANRMRWSHSAFVRFEAGAGAGARTPQIGFGEAALAPAVWHPDEAESRGMRRRVRVRGRQLRMARLCRPSPHGGEKCALIREVAWER
jgi:hypothetical protein